MAETRAVMNTVDGDNDFITDDDAILKLVGWEGLISPIVSFA